MAKKRNSPREAFQRNEIRLKDTCEKYIFLLDPDDKLDGMIIAKKLGMTLAEYTRRAIKEANIHHQQLLFRKKRINEG